MTDKQKKAKIAKLAKSILKDSYKAGLAKIDKALNSGAIDISNWDDKCSPMVVPKTIVTAVLMNESRQYDGRGTFVEKQVKKDAKNIDYFL